MAIAVAPRPAVVEPRFGGMPPNWFASVMGTGIVANVVPALGVHSGALFDMARMVWLIAAGWLVVLTVLVVRRGRSWLADPVLSHFYGAPAMAVLTVGAGTLLFGKDVLGSAMAIGVSAGCWIVGTVGGLVVAIVVPMRMIRTGRAQVADAFAGWLMPVVPPMVSAATGSALIPHLRPGQARQAMLLACYGMFVFAFLASAIVIVVLGMKVRRYGVGPARMVPTLFIVLGPLGQSITAANLLGTLAPSVLPAPYGPALEAFGLLYGVPVFIGAMAWLLFAGTVVRRTVQAGMPFSLTWWSFTFPIGTCVTGAAALARRTHLGSMWAAAIALYILLVAAWLVVSARTVGRTAHGTLFATS
jgi:tellurite resistance protein TehA-like permease